MTITAELHRENLATVYATPSLLRRVLFRAPTTERNACRVAGQWLWDASGRLVTGPELDALLDAQRPKIEVSL